MKNRYLAGFIGVLCSCFSVVYGQGPVPVKQQIPDKPFLFSQFPEKTYCSSQDLLRLFKLEAASNTTIQLTGAQALRATVIEKIERNASVTSINVRLTEYKDALFNLTYNSQTNKINGRVIHPQSGDVLVLTEEGGRYYLKKELQKFFMTE